MAAGEHKNFPSFPLINLSICFCLVHSALLLTNIFARLCPYARRDVLLFSRSLGKGWVSMESSVPGPPSGSCAYSVQQYGFH